MRSPHRPDVVMLGGFLELIETRLDILHQCLLLGSSDRTPNVRDGGAKRLLWIRRNVALGHGKVPDCITGPLERFALWQSTMPRSSAIPSRSTSIGAYAAYVICLFLRSSVSPNLTRRPRDLQPAFATNCRLLSRSTDCKVQSCSNRLSECDELSCREVQSRNFSHSSASLIGLCQLPLA